MSSSELESSDEESQVFNANRSKKKAAQQMLGSYMDDELVDETDRALRYRSINFKPKTRKSNAVLINDLEQLQNGQDKDAGSAADKVVYNKRFVANANPVEYNLIEMKEDAQVQPNQPSTMAKEKFGFGAELLARMGYQVGKGLGVDGQGIIDPVQVKLRPERAGLGKVREKIDIAQSDRAPEPRGMGLKSIDISKKKTKIQKFKTCKQILELTEGSFTIPKTISKLIDYTGEKSDILLPDNATNHFSLASSYENPKKEKLLLLGTMAQKEVSDALETWQNLEQRRKYAMYEISNNESNLEVLKSDSESLLKVIEDVKMLLKEKYTDFDVTIGCLKSISAKMGHIHSFDALEIDEIAAAVLAPFLKSVIRDWDPFLDPYHFHELFGRVVEFFDTTNHRDHTDLENDLGIDKSESQPSQFDNLLYAVWYPKIRSFFQDWKSFNSEQALNFWDAWNPILPPSLRNLVSKEIIIPNLQYTFSNWKLSRVSKNSYPLTAWLFPWFSRLDSADSQILFDEFDQQLSHLLANWKVDDDLIKEMNEWIKLLGESKVQVKCVRYIIPKLCNIMDQDFKVDPSDQSMEVINLVFLWTKYLPKEETEKLILNFFFPKWLNVLYQWLKSGADFNEIGEWYQWWKSVLPQEIQMLPTIKNGFKRALDLINSALDLGEGNISKLAAPIFNLHQSTTRIEDKRFSSRESIFLSDLNQGIKFQDIVEEFCTENDLLFIPLNRSHIETGLRLYRICSAYSRSIGFDVYFRGEVLWVLIKSDQIFIPMSLKEILQKIKNNETNK